jgi:hypothetical protein
MINLRISDHLWNQLSDEDKKKHEALNQRAESMINCGENCTNEFAAALKQCESGPPDKFLACKANAIENYLICVRACHGVGPP